MREARKWPSLFCNKSNKDTFKDFSSVLLAGHQLIEPVIKPNGCILKVGSVLEWK